MNSIGTLFRITIYGESHGESMGVVIDGVKSGLKVNNQDIIQLLLRRRPSSITETSRIEEDDFQITSGVFNGFTTGAPVNVIVRNKKYDSTIYEKNQNFWRSSHIDFVKNKYGSFFDYRGGGPLSGRLTVLYVIAGYFAKIITKFDVTSEIIIPDINSLNFKKTLESGDSLGGLIQVKAKTMAFLGEPIFNKVSSTISSLLFSVGSVKGVYFGESITDYLLTGSKYVDEIINKNGTTKTNRAGGINCGITNGNDLLVNIMVRPISSFKLKQYLFDTEKQKQIYASYEGKHDSFHLPRMQVVLESMVHIGLADLFLQKKARD